MASRPRLKPYFRPLRRGCDSVQLGVSGESGGVVITGLTPADIALLDRLDGSLTEQDLYAVAAGCGVTRPRADELLSLLREHRLLVTDRTDRADLARLAPGVRQVLRHDAETMGLVRELPGDPFADITERGRRHVVVSGSGQLPWSIATLLRSGGVGRVDLGRWAADIVDRELRDDRVRPCPDLVVLVGEGAVDPSHGEPWRRRDVAQLPVVSDGRRIVVGPLVGAAPDLPCLRCLEMSRADRDAAWPAVMAQLTPAGGVGEIHGESTLVSIAAGLVGMVTYSFLAGEPVPAGVSVEVTMPWPRLDHRRWQRHPRCPDHSMARASARPGDRTTEPRVTMTG
jgi:hypothetical protein